MDEEQDRKDEDNEPENRQVPLFSQWSSVMDDIIEQAVNEGFFDNLGGKGKPLNLSKDSFGQEQKLAFQLLKHNDYTLPWISKRAELLQAIEDLRVEIRSTWTQFQGEYLAAQGDVVVMGLRFGWDQHIDQWHKNIRELNRRITNANLKMPVPKLEVIKLSLDSELNRGGASRDLG